MQNKYTNKNKLGAITNEFQKFLFNLVFTTNP